MSTKTINQVDTKSAYTNGEWRGAKEAEKEMLSNYGALLVIAPKKVKKCFNSTGANEEINSHAPVAAARTVM